MSCPTLSEKIAIIRTGLDPAVDKKMGQWFAFDQLPSTNQYLLDHASHLSKGSVCLSNAQTLGRGRQGKSWQSPAGNLYFSLLWRVKTSPYVSLLPLITGVALCECLNRHYPLSTEIKWPNDIYHDNKKLAGILLESSIRGAHISAVIGIGLNIKAHRTMSQTIEQPWTNMATAGAKEVSLNTLVAQFLNILIPSLIQFEAGQYEAFQRAWIDHDMTQGKTVFISNRHSNTSGIAKGIDQYGNLIVNTGEKNTHFSSGETSLKFIDHATSKPYSRSNGKTITS